MTRSSLCLVAAAALLTSCLTRYAPKGRAVPYQGHFATLPSGLRFVIYEMPHVDRFRLAMTYRAGSVDDPPGKEGLAHLAEHLAFRSGPAPGAPRLWDRLVGSGMFFNAATDRDTTAFWEVGKPSDLPAALAIEAARLRDPLAGVTEDDLAIERDVVLSERRERFDWGPTFALREMLLEVAFAGHPYGRPVIGTPESIRRITLDDVRAYARERFRPASAVLVVVSPLTVRQTYDAVMAALEPIAGDQAAPVKPIAYQPPAPPPPPAREPELAVRRGPVEAPHLLVAWRVPGAYAGHRAHAAAAATTLDFAIGFHLGNPSFRDVVDWWDVELVELDGASLVVVDVRLRDGREAARVLDTLRFASGYVRTDMELPVWEGYEGSRRVAWHPKILAGAALLIAGYMRLEDLPALPIARHVRATGRADYLGDWQKEIDEQLRDGLEDYGAEHLKGKLAYALLVAPDGGAVPSEITRAPEREVPAYLEPLEDDAPLVPPPPPAAVQAAVAPPGLDRAERRRLRNGVEVVVAKRGSLPIADVRVVLRIDPEGTADVPAGLPGLALAASSTFQTLDTIYVAPIDSARRAPGVLVRGVRGSSANLDVLLERAAKRVTTVRADSARTFDAVKRFWLHDEELAAARPPDRVARALLGGLFPGHPYGESPTLAGEERMSIGDAQRWIATNLRPDRATVIVVSDLDPSPELWGWIEDRFGRWEVGRGAAPPAAVPDPPLPAQRSVLLVDRPGAAEALVAVGFRAPPFAGRDEVALDAAAWLLESRLRRRLRVEEGVTYGIGVQAIEWPRAAVLVASTSVEAASTARALRTILDGARALAEAPAPGQSVGRARWQAARDFSYRFDRVGGCASALEEIAARGLAPTHFESLPGSLATVDPARVQAAARSLSVGREVIVIAGDAKVLGPQLRAAGFEPER